MPALLMILTVFLAAGCVKRNKVIWPSPVMPDPHGAVYIFPSSPTAEVCTTISDMQRMFIYEDALETEVKKAATTIEAINDR